MYIQVEKNNNKYEVTPNVTPSTNNKLYAFVSDEESDAGLYLPSPIPPATKEDLVCIPINQTFIQTSVNELNEWFKNKIIDPNDITEYTKVSDTEIIYSGPGYGGWHFYRNAEYDVEINVW